MGFSVLQHDGAERDARIAVAVEAEVAHGARVHAALGFFQLGDDLHGSDFRRAADGAGGEGCAHHVVGGTVGAQAALDVADDVHDVRVALNDHEVVHFHAREFARAAHVVAREVHEHEVLGALLRIGEEFGGVRVVLGGSRAAFAGAGDRADFDFAVHGADVDLGAAADEAERGASLRRWEFHAEHVGRRIHETQRAVERERVAGVVGGEPLRGHDLEDVAGVDVFVRLADHRVEFLARGVARRSSGRRRRGDRKWRELVRLREFRGDVGDRFRRACISCVCVTLDKGIRDDAQSALEVIEDEHGLREDEEALGQAELIAFRRRHRGLEEAHNVVAEVADRAAEEARAEFRRLVRQRHVAEARHVFFQVRERILFRLKLARRAVLGDADRAPVALHHDARADNYE